MTPQHPMTPQQAHHRVDMIETEFRRMQADKPPPFRWLSLAVSLLLFAAIMVILGWHSLYDAHMGIWLTAIVALVIVTAVVVVISIRRVNADWEKANEITARRHERTARHGRM